MSFSKASSPPFIVEAYQDRSSDLVKVRWSSPSNTDVITGYKIILGNEVSMLLPSYTTGIEFYLPNGVGQTVFIQSESMHLPSELINATIFIVASEYATSIKVVV